MSSIYIIIEKKRIRFLAVCQSAKPDAVSPWFPPKFLSSGFGELACLPMCPPVNKLDKGYFKRSRIALCALGFGYYNWRLCQPKPFFFLVISPPIDYFKLIPRLVCNDNIRFCFEICHSIINSCLYLTIRVSGFLQSILRNCYPYTQITCIFARMEF